MRRTVLFPDDGSYHEQLNAIRAAIKGGSPHYNHSIQMTQDAINAVRRRLKTDADQGENPSSTESDWYRMKDEQEIVALWYTIHDDVDPNDPNTDRVPYVMVDTIQLLKIV
jgi:proteasome lid subunit RPN8/RPN11